VVARGPFSVSHQSTGADHTLLLEGELDLATAPQLEEMTDRLVRAGGTLLLDLRALRFIDSTGLLAIIRTREACDERGCALALIQGPAPVRRLFEITGLLDRLPFVDPSE
jgi:anti-sigma B factor antagonist